jgi:hypothetical protein
MKINATAFRKNLYQLLDKVLEEGEPIEIERKGRKILVMEKKRKDIYEIFDQRGQLFAEPDSQLNVEALSATDKDWEKSWEQQWDKWLEEK